MVCGVRPLAHRVHASPPGVLRAQLNRAEPHALRRTCVPVPGPKLAARRWRVRGHGCFWAHTPAAKLAVPEHPKSPLSRRRLPREPRHRERRMGEGSAANAAKVVSSEPHARSHSHARRQAVLETRDRVWYSSTSPSSRWSRIVVAKNDGPAAGRCCSPFHDLKPPRCEYEIISWPAHATIGGCGWQKRASSTQPRERRSSSRAALLHGGRRGCHCWRRLGLLLCSSRRPCISPTAAAAVNLFCARHEGFQRGGGGGGRGL
jgi:hypothetical protein